MARLAYQEKQRKQCFICEKRRIIGITIGSQFMCETCERDVVSTDTSDSNYSFYLHRLERLKVSLPRHFH